MPSPSRLAAAFLSPLFAAGFAAAQESPEEEARRLSAEEEVVVTGSRIRRKDLTTPAPVVILSREQFEQSGKITIGDFLQTIPAQGNAYNTQVNNYCLTCAGGDGMVQVNLRSLGRTLVLVNGRRYPTSVGAGGILGGSDLTSIPAAAVDRVEVLLDGASAIYGSDAIGGVVNIITRKGFKGTELSAYSGVSQRGDGMTYDLSATTGQATEFGNVVFSAGLYRQGTVWGGDRAFANPPRLYDFSSGTVLGFGSSFIPAGRFRVKTPPAGEGSPALKALLSAFPNANQFMFCLPDDPNPCVSGWRPWTNPLLSPDGDGYNFQPANYLITPSQRISLYSTGDLALGSRTRAYYEASFTNRQSALQFAPEPLITNFIGVVVSKDNTYNPFGVDLSNVSRRLVEMPPRIFEQDVNSFRIVAGLDGTLPDTLGPLKGWFWDFSLNFGRTEVGRSEQGSLFIAKVQAAVGPSWVDANGTPRCGTDAAHDIPGCVPLDLFHGPGSIQPNQLAGLTFIGVGRDIDQLTTVQFNTTGELFRLFAEQPAGLAAGYEYRLVFRSHVPDALAASQQSADINDTVTKGAYHVNEGYAELSLPIVSNVAGAETLEASAAARAFNYSTSGWGVTYKFGGRWRPVRDVTLRSTWSTAFRAPGIDELNLGPIPSLFFSSFFPDPCAGPGIDPASPRGRACGAAVNNGNDSDFLGVFRGNPNLKPETARILTAGIVLEPQWLKTFSATIDYYRFDVDDVIGFSDVNLTLRQCYPSEAGTTPSNCGLVLRDPDTHQLSQVLAPLINIGTIRTDGIDVALRYSLPTGAGRFRFSFDGVWLHRFDVQQPDGTILHGRGTYDVGLGAFQGVNPAFRFNAGANWSFQGLTAAVNTRFIGSFQECGDQDGNSALCSIDGVYRRTVSSSILWDLFASYKLRSVLGTTTLAAGVNNLFDRPPPSIYSSFTTNSDPTNYDYMGRYFYAHLTQKF